MGIWVSVIIYCGFPMKVLGRILFPEGATAIGSEVFHAPYALHKPSATYALLRQPLEFGSTTINGQKLQSWNLALTGFELCQ